MLLPLVPTCKNVRDSLGSAQQTPAHIRSRFPPSCLAAVPFSGADCSVAPTCLKSGPGASLTDPAPLNSYVCADATNAYLYVLRNDSPFCFLLPLYFAQADHVLFALLK